MDAMSHEPKPHHHHHHHSHGRRNWVLPLVCVAMVVGGGYWMNATSTDPVPQPPAAASGQSAGPVGRNQAETVGPPDAQADAGMESLGATGQPAGMPPAEPGVGTQSGMASGVRASGSTTSR